MLESAKVSSNISGVKMPLIRRRSLVDDARFESAKNREALIKDLKKTETKEYDLTEEEILLLGQQSDDDSDDSSKISTSLMFSAQKELLDNLPDILDCIKIHGGHLHHLETRLRQQDEGNDIYVRLEIARKGLLSVIRSTRQADQASVTVLNGHPLKEVWYPKHISELDRCTQVVPKFEPELDSSHPGFSDPVYRARRTEIAQIAYKYKQGEIIPRVDYTDEEIKTWGIVFNELRALYSKFACSNYQRVFRTLEEECGYRPDNIPQLQDVSIFLKKRSGFVLRPAAGLIGARDFLSSLAFRVFHCTQYVRHSSSPEHTPEPDCIHELLGHAPMLADLEFAKFSQEIGLASLGATDQDIEKLATVYWFTVEFGLCKEHNEVRAYGAGLLSSFGELQHAVSGIPRLLPFEPETTSLHPYQDQDFQDVYFVAETFQDAKEKIRKYVRNTIYRRFDIIYDPYTETMQEMDSLSKLENKIEDIATGALILKDAIKRFQRDRDFF